MKQINNNKIDGTFYKQKKISVSFNATIIAIKIFR